MELKITKEKVLEAAEKCSDAKAILETLFPEVFESLGQIFFHKDGMDVGSVPAITLNLPHDGLVNSVHLESSFDWLLVEEVIGYTLEFKRIK